ncbi:hypothetical protein [Urechidicola vernalis]|uniref:Lipoprotein n=1 Tax=Urechidicola vernalis TaxID=3075600 RepID=A0ABU2Y4W8_9FLAO|nr:hypothetical protein [Urechidicola sp. P050]MDT0552752.1 hypothetical protein [Urechidicola sp. P050]
MKRILFSLLVIIGFTSCVSVVEVVDQYRNENDQFESLKGKKVLVINKTNDKVARERFERDLADRLRSAGVDAVESHVAFPNMEHKKRTEEDVEAEVKKVVAAGYTGAVVTGIRDKQTKYQSETTGGYDRNVNTGEGMGLTIYNYSYHYYGFGSFYGSVYNSDLGSVYVEPETTTTSYNVYIIEAVTYNLTAEKEDQLLGVITVRVTDPTSYEEVADKYTKMIAKQFK